jgi:hypothetical protein
LSEPDNDADGGETGKVGLELLLGGGMAEAITAVEATLATAQGAAAQVLTGLSRVQAVGATTAAVPPAPHPVQSPAASPEAPVAPAPAVRPAEQFGPPPAVPPVGPEQAASFAPFSAPGGRPDTPKPLPFAAKAAAPASTAAPPPLTAPAPSSESLVGVAPGAAPVLLASFAPTAAVPAQADGAPAADTAEPHDPRVATAPERAQNRWQAPAAPIAAPGWDAAAPRESTPAPTASAQGGPTGGDVFLDGSRVGTWLADHLAREAGRPQTGATGFDPRLTPAWPGTLQGN